MAKGTIAVVAVAGVVLVGGAVAFFVLRRKRGTALMGNEVAMGSTAVLQPPPRPISTNAYAFTPTAPARAASPRVKKKKHHGGFLSRIKSRGLHAAHHLGHTVGDRAKALGGNAFSAGLNLANSQTGGLAGVGLGIATGG